MGISNTYRVVSLSSALRFLKFLINFNVEKHRLASQVVIGSVTKILSTSVIPLNAHESKPNDIQKIVIFLNNRTH